MIPLDGTSFGLVDAAKLIAPTLLGFVLGRLSVKWQGQEEVRRMADDITTCGIQALECLDEARRAFMDAHTAGNRDVDAYFASRIEAIPQADADAFLTSLLGRLRFSHDLSIQLRDSAASMRTVIKKHQTLKDRRDAGFGCGPERDAYARAIATAVDTLRSAIRAVSKKGSRDRRQAVNNHVAMRTR